uniref:diphthine methyl ester synthase n=1 Tax=Strigamia maritima TaxID=126957 RepID=T1JF66_STRMM
MLYFIGLGLGDMEDITVKGLKIIKSVKRAYLESYTSILTDATQAQLEDFYGRQLIPADRDLVETQSDEILKDAETEDIAFLVIGDSFGATTHTDLILRAKQKQIPYKVIHNASIMNAVGCCGLQLYNFGETVSIVLWTETWQPTSFVDKIIENKKRGLHTLCLLDIKMKERTIENLMRNRKIYEPPRFMSTSEAASQLVQSINNLQEIGEKSIVLTEDSLCVGLARVGSDTQRIVVTTLKDMSTTDIGPPLHSLVIPGYLHPLEVDMLRLHAKDADFFDECVKTISIK